MPARRTRRSTPSSWRSGAPPPPELAKEANAQPGIYDRDFAEFWASEARERVSWSTPFDQVCEWDPPYARWFLGGRLNASPSNVL